MIYIMSLQAKDLVDGNLEIKSMRRYQATLDDPLEKDKLEQIHKKVFRNNRFVFKKDKHEYTDDIISISFDYRHEDYSTSELRKKLYSEGFMVNNNQYVRYKRSSGSARVGKCLFIRKEMYKQVIKWSRCGLKLRKDQVIDLAALEAYISLPLSSVIDKVTIDPEEILLIDDYESEFEDKVMITEVNKNNRLETYEGKMKVCNSIWDGQMLLDVSVFGEKYRDKGMLLLRNRMFKSCGFNTNIQKFFSDNGITSVDQLNGKTLATDIKQIKMITTPSSIKFLKFGTFEQFLENMDSEFGVVKYDKPPHFMEGEMVQTHYQLLNTLEFSKEEMEEFLEDSLRYINLLKNNLAVMRYHLKMKTDNELKLRGMESTSDMIYTLLGVNDKISQTQTYMRFRDNLIQAYVNNIRSGHVLIDGNYSTLFGNGYEMLLHSIGKFDGKSILKGDEVISYRFDNNKKILGVRSPHITMSNLWLCNNVRRKEYEDYFNLSKQILCINSINNNVLERLNGADFDSDSILITDNPLLIKKAEQNYCNFLVPTSNVCAKKTKRKYNTWHMYDLDKKTAVNKIGEIVNLSQILNSHLWELKKKGEDYQEVFRDVCQLAVMSNVEIDSAKKEFTIDNTVELDLLRLKYKEVIKKKPMLFYYLPNKQNYDRKKKNYRTYDTSVDYLQEIMTKRMRKVYSKRQDKIEFKDIFDKVSYKSNIDTIRKGATRFSQKIDEYNIAIKEIWASEFLSKQEKYLTAISVREDYENVLKNMDITKEELYYLINKIDNSRAQQKMFLLLYGVAKKTLLSLLIESKTSKQIVVPHTEGEFVLYGKKYKRIEY